MFRLFGFLAVTVTAVMVSSNAHGENWPGWRGPRGDGTSLEKGLPTKWSETENIAWKVAIPGKGHASPVIWEDRVFLATCDERTREREVLAYDRRNGNMLWKHVVLTPALEAKHNLNSYASSTPCTDGKTVYVTFLEPDSGEKRPSPGNMVVAAYDVNGEQKWMVRPGRFSSVHGFCASPVIYQDKLIVNGDHDGDSYLLALDRATGEVAWRVPRENKTRSYAVPYILNIAGKTQMLLPGSKQVVSYNPDDGSKHWFIQGPTEQFVASMVENKGLLFLTCGFPERHMVCLDPSGSGDVTATHIKWRDTKGASYVPSPIAAGNYFLCVADNGVCTCFESVSGKKMWAERIGTHYSASAITSEGLAYFVDDAGITKVIKPGPALDVLAVNKLAEYCYASPAVSQGQIFIRSEKSLYCIGAATAE